MNESQKNAHPTSDAISAMAPNEISFIAIRFIQRYYQVMHERPQELQHFYVNDATMIFEDQYAYGRSSIYRLLQQRNIGGANVNILHHDARVPRENCVCITIEGELSVDEGPFRKFTRTLNIIERGQGNFLISVDLFQFLDT